MLQICEIQVAGVHPELLVAALCPLVEALTLRPGRRRPPPAEGHANRYHHNADREAEVTLGEVIPQRPEDVHREAPADGVAPDETRAAHRAPALPPPDSAPEPAPLLPPVQSPQEIVYLPHDGYLQADPLPGGGAATLICGGA